MVPDPSRLPPRTVDEVTGRTPLPLSTSTLARGLPAAAAEVLALLPDPEALTAVVTECIDQRGTLVPDLPSEIDPDAGLRGLVQGMFCKASCPHPRSSWRQRRLPHHRHPRSAPGPHRTSRLTRSGDGPDETGLPTVHYLPKEDVQAELRPIALRTHCLVAFFADRAEAVVGER